MMKLHEIQYLVKEGCRNTWKNRLMALASVGVLVCCLLLTGFAYLVYVNANQIFQSTAEQNVMAIYLDADLPEDEVTKMQLTLNNMPNVATVEFLSKEDFLAQYADSLESATMESFMGENNPLPDTYIVSLKDLELFQQTLDEITALDGVEEVSYDAGTAEVLASVRRVVLAIGGSVIVVLLVVSLFIIVNTIKLTVHNRRLEIYIMKSVGATDAFIRFPFVVEGLLVGATAGAIGYGLIYLLYNAVVKNFQFDSPLLKLVDFGDQWLPLLICFLGGGVLVGVCGSVISMRKYLQHEGGIQS